MTSGRPTIPAVGSYEIAPGPRQDLTVAGGAAGLVTRWVRIVQEADALERRLHPEHPRHSEPELRYLVEQILRNRQDPAPLLRQVLGSAA